MNKFTRLFMSFLMTLMFFSCGEPENNTPNTPSPKNPIIINPDINISPIVYADQTNTAEDIKFTTSEAWNSRITSISENATSKTTSDWVSLNPSSGKSGGDHAVQVTLKENLTGKPRKAKVEFICGSSSIEITIEQKEVTQSGENLDETKLVLLTPNEVMVLQLGGKDTVQFICKTEWKASVDMRASEWLTISSDSGTPNDGSLVITTLANNTHDQRNGSITLTSGTLSETITVNQKQKDALIVSSSKIELPNSESAFGVEVNANIDFDVEVKNPWIRQVKTKGLTSTTLSFIADSNMSEESRQGIITIKSGSLKDTINVYQAQQNIFVLSKTEHFISDVGGQIEIDIKSNVPYELTMPSEEWVKESNTRAVSSHTRYFTVNPNTDTSPRQAILTFATTDGSGLSQQVTINQTQKDALIVSADTIYTDSDHKIIEIEVNSNIKFNVTTSDRWVTQIEPTKNLEKHVLNFSIGVNFGKKRRTAKINFISSTITQSIVVSQAPTGPEMPDVKEGEIEILTAGTLSQIITKPLLGTYTKLKVKGYMNSADVKHFTPDDLSAPSQLKELDLSEVTFTDDKIDGITYQKQLHTVKLPESLKILGDEAFNDCIALVNIDFGQNPQLQQLLGGHRQDMIYRDHWAVGSFRNCKSLKSFTLPASVTIIEAGIFTGCEALESFNFAPNCKIKLLSGLKYSYSGGVLYESNMQGFFEKCNSLKTITIPSSVEAIGTYTFKGSALEHIEIPSTVNAINTIGLFMDCKNLVSVKLPRAVTSVGERMFSGCESLKTFTFEGGIKSIGDYGFSNCKLIENFEIKELESIGKFAFEGTAFKSFTVPNYMKVLPNGIFMNCEQLTSVNLNQLVEIGNNCFQGCSALKSITIPSTVTKIGEGAFGGCESLDEFKLTSGDITLAGGLFSKANNNLTDKKSTKLTEFIIPSGITSIKCDRGLGGQINKVTFEPGSQCRIFDGVCASLDITSITIPESVVEIGGFSDCKKLTEIKGMQGVTTINIRAFQDCKNITSINLPSSLRVIREGAFSGTSISTLIIPEGVESLGDLSYYVANLEKLTKLVLPSTLKELGDIGSPMLYECIVNGSDLKLTTPFKNEGLFEHCPMISKVVIGKKLKSLTGKIYSKNITSIQFEEESVCQSISGCFSGAKLDELKLPESIKEIGKYAFSGADIKNLILPTSLTTIGEGAFSGADIKNLILPTSLTTIGEGAFSGIKMTKLSINSKHLSSIGDGAFANSNLTELYINGNDLVIGAFVNASNLNNITFGKDLQSINTNKNFGILSKSSIKEVIFEDGCQIKTLGNYLFAGTSSLNIVNLPQSIESLGDYLFSSTTLAMDTITFPNVTNIGKGTFSGTLGVKKLILPKVETLGIKALNNFVSLTKLELSATLKSIDGFSLKSTPLTELIIHSATPPTKLNSSFTYTENCTLKVPKGSIDAYKTSTLWKVFTSIEEIK